MGNLFVRVSLITCITLNAILPATLFANCEGSPSPADFLLYKNLQANLISKMDADSMQRYKVEWFIGGKNMGSVIKKGGESFVLKGSPPTSQSFSKTDYYQKGDEWIQSRKKIFPNSYGGMEVRFDDGACDNSFITSPDLTVTIKIN